MFMLTYVLSRFSSEPLLPSQWIGLAMMIIALVGIIAISGSGKKD
jgi:hypothetical protein